MTVWEDTRGIGWDDAEEFWTVKIRSRFLYAGTDQASAHSIAEYYEERTGEKVAIEHKTRNYRISLPA